MLQKLVQLEHSVATTLCMGLQSLLQYAQLLQACHCAYNS